MKKDHEEFVRFRGQFNRFITMGLYLGAAEFATERLVDEDENDRPRTEHIREAMTEALKHAAMDQAGKIADEYRDYVTDEQRAEFAELVLKVG